MSLRAMHFDGDDVAELENASVDEILQWIRQLDGREDTVVAVTHKNGGNAEIGGGNDNQYKVNARIAGKHYDLASSLSDSYERVPLVTCDELCFYPKKYIVTLDQALTAMKYFCLTGERCPDFAWSDAEDYYPLEPEICAKDEPPR